jgi:hypothetical protein
MAGASACDCGVTASCCGGERGCAAEAGCAGPGSWSGGCADAGVAGFPSMRASRRGRTGSCSGGWVGVELVGSSVEVRATWLDRAGVTTSGRGSAGLGRAAGSGCDRVAGAGVDDLATCGRAGDGSTEAGVRGRTGALASERGAGVVGGGKTGLSGVAPSRRRTRDSARPRSPGRASGGATVGPASVGDAGVGDTAGRDAAVGSGWGGSSPGWAAVGATVGGTAVARARSGLGSAAAGPAGAGAVVARSRRCTRTGRGVTASRARGADEAGGGPAAALIGSVPADSEPLWSRLTSGAGGAA